VHSAFDGEGARIAGGRWNQAGTPVVYTSGTLALAALESLVHFDMAEAPDDLVCMDAAVPDSIRIGELKLNDLPDNWRQYPAPEELARLGTGWVESGTTAVLAVPSAVIPSERNYLINPAHRDFGRIRIGVPQLFVFDPRLLLR